MDYSKEFLLAGAVAVLAKGIMVLESDIKTGVVLILIGTGIFIGRGFYKKYVEDKK